MIFHNIINNSSGKTKGNEDDAVVRAFASHQCDLGSNPGVDAICGLSLLLVLSLAPRGFSSGTKVSFSPTFPNFNSIRNDRRRITLWICCLYTVILILIFFIIF